MVKMIEPNYVHYTRIKFLPATEAQELLAIFELRDKEFSDEAEYKRSFELETNSAYKVLSDAFDAKDIKYYCNDVPYDFDDFGRKKYGYYLCNIEIRSNEFFIWALGLNYNLPDVLVKFAKGSDYNIVSEIHGDQIAKDTQQLDESPKTGEAPIIEEAPAEVPSETETVPEEVETPETNVAIDSENSPNTDESIGTVVNNDVEENNGTNHSNAQLASQNKPRKGGPKKCTLSMAVEIAYLKLLDQGNTNVLMPGMRDAFMECFREMATDGKRNSDKGVLELIKEVRKSKLGKYTIVTHARPNKANHKKIEELSDEHGTSQVTRFLTSLRAKHPPLPK